MNEDARAAAMQHAVVELLAAISSADGPRFRAQVTDDLVTFMPYALPPFPKSSSGGDTIAASITGAGRLFSAFRLWATRFYPCPAADAVVIEAESEGTLAKGGGYSNQYVFIFHFNGDRIASWTEYFDPNRLPDLS